MALFPSGAAIKGRVLASFPTLVEGSGGIRVSKQNGIWTIEPSWSDLSIETTLADASTRQLWIYNPDTSVYTRLSVQYLLDNLPAGPSGDDGSLIFVQNSAPATDKPEGSLWIDADSTDLDLYHLVSSVWTDTTVNLKGATGATGASYAATSTSSQTIGNSGTKTFTTQAGLAYLVGTRIRAADASSPTANWMEGVVTSYSSTTLEFTADKSLGSGTLTNWTLSVAGQYGADGAGTGDVTGQSSSVDSEIALFSSTTGKVIKRATNTGMLKASSGVIETAAAGTDYLAPAAIGVTVQGYDANTAKLDAAQQWTAQQRASATTLTNNSAPAFSGSTQLFIALVSGSAFNLVNPSSNPSDMTMLVIRFEHHASTGSYGVNLGNKYKATGWSPSSANSKVDVTVWQYNSTADVYELIGYRNDVRS